MNKSEHTPKMTSQVLMTEDFTKDLPDDTIIALLSFLGPVDLCACSSVSYRFYQLSSHASLWKWLCKYVWLLDVPHGLSDAHVLRRLSEKRDDDLDEEGDDTRTGDALSPSLTKMARVGEERCDVASYRGFYALVQKIVNDDQVWTQLNSSPSRGLLQNDSEPVNDQYELLAAKMNKLCYREYQLQYGGLASVFRKVKTLSDQLDSYLHKNCPPVFESLLDGASREEMQQFLADCQIDEACSIPKELECFYRMHNGQSTQDEAPSPLFGGYIVYDELSFLTFLKLDSVVFENQFFRQNLKWMTNCLPIIRGGRMLIAIAMKDFTFMNTIYRRGMVIQISGRGTPFVLSGSFIEWFEKYVIDLTQRNLYEFNDGYIERFPLDGSIGSDTTTNGVRIQCNALFRPESSDIDNVEPYYFFSYRIKISMDENAPKNLKCQLRSRCWVIKDANGVTDSVNGPGVIGLHPVIEPGSTFSYCSSTNSSTPTGSMEGYFTMENLSTGEVFNAKIDPFELNVKNHC